MSYLTSAAQSMNATVPDNAGAYYIAGYLLGASGIDQLNLILDCFQNDWTLNQDLDANLRIFAQADDFYASLTGFDRIFEAAFEKGLKNYNCMQDYTYTYIRNLNKYQYEYLSNRRSYDLINLHMSTNYKTMDAITDEIKKAVDVASIDREGFHNIGKLHGQLN